MNKVTTLLKVLTLLLGLGCFALQAAGARPHKMTQNQIAQTPNTKTHPLYGTASYYAKKFDGRKMANGEIYQRQRFSAACNVLPLNTWIKVTNLKNKRSVIVKITDRMNHKNKRLVDLSEAAAKKLGYFSSGVTKVKIVVLKNRGPAN